MNCRRFLILALSLFLPFAQAAGVEFYKKPLWFDVINHGAEISSQVIRYDLKNTETMQWGPLLLREDFFSVNLTSRQKLDAEGSKMAFYNQEDMVLFFDWPKEIVPYGLLEVRDTKGDTLWSKRLDDVELRAWHEKSLQVKDQLRKQGKNESDIENNTLLKKTYAFFRSKNEPGPDLKIDTAYKFCLTNTVGDSFARICSPFFTMKTVGPQVEMQIEHVAQGQPPMVKYQNAPQPLSGTIAVKNDQPVHFLAQLKSGALIEFSSPVPALKIYDMALVSEKDPDAASIVAEDPLPIFMTAESLKSKDPLDPINKLWKAPYKLSDRKIYLPGKAGGFFQYNLSINYLPSEKIRPFADERNLNATYSREDKQKVRVGDKTDEKGDGKPKLEVWTALNPEPGKWNRSYLKTKDDKHEFKTYLDIYRGYAGEASLRLTGIAANRGTTVGMVEAHVGYWFNSLDGWDDYYLSRQRWGLSAKYVSLLSSVPARSEDGTSEDVKIQSAIVDLRYRFTPGLWERDETWGALLSYENLTYADYQIPKIGYGVFWARTMPKFFDDIFNMVSFMRYPKWVDLDIAKYSTSMDSKYTLGDDYAINFHGKILWTPKFYGEAGFGAKKYYFLNQETQQGATLNTFYGTLGLGVNF